MQPPIRRHDGDNLPDSTKGFEPAVVGPDDAPPTGPSSEPRHSSPQERSRRHQTLKRVAGASVIGLSLLAMAPQLVAWSPLRHEVPRFRLHGFEGRMRVGQALLSWWSPIVLRDIELFGPDGEPFIHIGNYTEQRSVFTLLFRRNVPSLLKIERPVLTLKLRTDGSNIEDALRPVLEHQRRRPTKERLLEVVDGELTTIDVATGRSATWKAIALNIHSSPTGSEANTLHLSTRLAGAEHADPLLVQLAWFSADSRDLPPEAPLGSVRVTTAHLPCTALDPLLARFIPDLDLSGTVTTDVHVAFFDRPAATNASSARVDGRLSISELKVSCPSRLGNDRFDLDSIELDGKVDSNGAVAQVERLDLKTDIGEFSATGRFPWISPATAIAPANLASRLDEADFAMRGDLDLVRLASLLPETLRLRDGMRLTEGRLRLDVSSKTDNERPRWQGRLETTRLAAAIGSERFSWEQPIRIAFDLHREGGHIAIDDLKCESDVIELSGSGNSDDARITGQCDLDRLGKRLGQFVDLSDRELKGSARIDAEWKRDAEGSIDWTARSTVEDFATGAHGRPLWSEPRLVSTLAGRLVDQDLRPVKIQSLQLTLAADEKAPDLSARLLEPIDLTADDPLWHCEIQIAGELSRWQARLRPFEVGHDWKVDGQVRTVSRIAASLDELAIESLSVDLTALQLSARGVDLSEPEARLSAAGRWNRAQRRLTLSVLELTSSAGSARGRDLVLALADGQLPQLAGQFEVHTDLDRVNPADAPPDRRSWAGRVNAEVTFAAHDGETNGQWHVAVEDLAIRRKVTKLIERRRGDVESIDLGPPLASPPRLAQGVPVDRRQRRAMERAERDARRDARRHEREVRKRADEIVLVPQTEWQTVWADPRMTLSGQARFDRQHDTVELTGLEALTAGARVTAKAHIAEASTRAVIDLDGEVDCDLEQLLARLKQSIGEHVRIVGNNRRTFSLTGPLRNSAASTEDRVAAVRQAAVVPTDDAALHPSDVGVRPAARVAAASAKPLVPLTLTGAAHGGWQTADLFGLLAGAGTIDLRLSQGIVAMQPLELSLSGGKLRLAPQLFLDAQPAMLVLPSGTVIQDVALSQDVCDTWLRFIAPILSEATRVEGRFSLDLAETSLPLADPASGALSGRIHIATAQVLAGPLFAEIGEVIGQIESAVRLGGSGDLLGLDKPLVRIDKQQVAFKLQDRRLFSSPLEFNVRNIPVRTRGSVGVDQTLDLVAEISLPADWVRRVRVLSRLEGKALEVPIKGTLRHPKVDASGIARFWEQFGQDALDSLLNGGLQKLLER